METKIIVVDKNTQLMLTTPDAEGRTCVYVELVEDKLSFKGGASIVNGNSLLDILIPPPPSIVRKKHQALDKL